MCAACEDQMFIECHRRALALVLTALTNDDDPERAHEAYDALLADLMPERQLWECWERGWEIRRTLVSLAQIAGVAACVAFDDPEGWVRARIADSHDPEKGMH